MKSRNSFTPILSVILLMEGGVNRILPTAIKDDKEDECKTKTFIKQLHKFEKMLRVCFKD